MIFPEYKYKYRHPIFEGGCGGIAFYINEKQDIKRHKPLLSENVIFPNGKKPKPIAPFICGHCGRQFYKIYLRNVERNHV